MDQARHYIRGLADRNQRRSLLQGDQQVVNLHGGNDTTNSEGQHLTICRQVSWNLWQTHCILEQLADDPELVFTWDLFIRMWTPEHLWRCYTTMNDKLLKHFGWEKQYQINDLAQLVCKKHICGDGTHLNKAGMQILRRNLQKLWPSAIKLASFLVLWVEPTMGSTAHTATLDILDYVEAQPKYIDNNTKASLLKTFKKPICVLNLTRPGMKNKLSYQITDKTLNSKIKIEVAMINNIHFYAIKWRVWAQEWATPVGQILPLVAAYFCLHSPHRTPIKQNSAFFISLKPDK